ncbi:hypothetical protein HHK36_005356 [Tetracentron sinense]|uniref:C2H2-type domain-containing protein n=1 Tax=Tetracentron sinense TaxID=13715 RepID=A0A834ZVA6_TETSI|nr:hypothetical protein HHK36_005356 [Tetracentron sinense]
MAGRKELGLPKTSSCSLREQAARITLRNVRSQGHTYVELREDGKRLIFFCTLCLAPCYSDSVLSDHLKGHLHTSRYATAKVTLLGPNPWPFNDGILFFHEPESPEKDKLSAFSNSSQDRFLNSNSNDHNLAIVDHGNISNSESDVYVSQNLGCVLSSHDKNLNANGRNDNLVIPGVVLKDKISDLQVRFIGFGEIAVRIREIDETSNRICRIWCAWLGEKDLSDGNEVMEPEYDFAVVIFSYNYELGRSGVLDDVRSLLPSSPCAEIDNGEGTSKKRKKSFSDPEDISESLSDQYGSSGEDSLASTPVSRLQLDRIDDQLQHARFISSKTIRRELRQQQRVASERMCDVCQHKMLPGKDVAALLNMKTGKLACSSRNVNGAFHVFHTSCLIHWILLHEFQIRTNQPSSPKMTPRPGRKCRAKSSEMQKADGRRATRPQTSVFCPECQGTGINIEGDQLEKPSVPLSEVRINKETRDEMPLDLHDQGMKEALCLLKFHLISVSGIPCRRRSPQQKKGLAEFCTKLCSTCEMRANGRLPSCPVGLVLKLLGKDSIKRTEESNLKCWSFVNKAVINDEKPPQKLYIMKGFGVSSQLGFVVTAKL